MNIHEIQTLAQSLVDIEIERKGIEDEKSLIKLELWENAKGGIRCNGGIVYWVGAGEEMRFNKENLREVLIEEGFNVEQIENIFERSKSMKPRDANIKIKLNS